MSSKNPINKSASIRQKLLNYAKAHKQDFQRTLDGYAIECILDRLAHSVHAERFLLKGALLFQVWKGLGNRPTRDIDLLGSGDNSIESVTQVFKDILSVVIADDALEFFPDRMVGERIKEDDEYEGVRVYVEGSLSGAIFKVQVDIGFGDAVTPAPMCSVFPRMLDNPEFSLLVYPPETVIAEKFDAIVLRGMLNSRMKDYYDLSILVNEGLSIEIVREAIINTFARRGTIVPVSCPMGLTDEFALDQTKVNQWRAFLRKSGLGAGELTDVVRSIRGFMMTIFEW